MKHLVLRGGTYINYYTAADASSAQHVSTFPADCLCFIGIRLVLGG